MESPNIKKLRTRYMKLEMETEQAWAELDEARATVMSLPLSNVHPAKQHALRKQVLIAAALEVERRHVNSMLLTAEGT